MPIIVVFCCCFYVVLYPTMPSITLVWEAGVADAAATTPARTLENAITRVLRESNLPITLHKIFHLTKGIKLIVESEDCVQNLQTPFITKNLKERIGLVFQPSLERLASCTLVIRPHNLATFDAPDEEILSSARRAAGIPPSAPIEIWKSEKLKTIKLTFQHRRDAEAAKKKGLPIGGFFFPAHQIGHDEFFNVMQCMKCYRFEAHTTRECKSNTVICSECSSEGHNYRHCPNPRPPRCINCRREGKDDAHRTLANSCPAKKEIIRRKRNEKYQEQQRKEHLPVIRAVEQTITNIMAPAQDPEKRWPTLPSLPQLSSTPKQKPEKKNNNQTSTKINQQIKIITTLSHEHNAAFPGTFNQVLNKLLRRNHIAEVDVGDDWPSAAILEAMEATPAQPHGEDPSMEATTLRDSPLPLAGAVFPSYWPEHELSFSEPSSPTSIPSPEKSSKNAKKKKKKKVRNLVQLSSEEEEETEETKPEKEEKPKEEIKTQEQEEKVEGEPPHPGALHPHYSQLQLIRPTTPAIIEDGDVVFPCGTRFPIPPAGAAQGYTMKQMAHIIDPKKCPRGGIMLIFTSPNDPRPIDACLPYDFNTFTQYEHSPY